MNSTQNSRPEQKASKNLQSSPSAKQLPSSKPPRGNSSERVILSAHSKNQRRTSEFRNRREEQNKENEGSERSRMQNSSFNTNSFHQD